MYILSIKVHHKNYIFVNRKNTIRLDLNLDVDVASLSLKLLIALFMINDVSKSYKSSIHTLIGRANTRGNGNIDIVLHHHNLQINNLESSHSFSMAMRAEMIVGFIATSMTNTIL